MKLKRLLAGFVSAALLATSFALPTNFMTASANEDALYSEDFEGGVCDWVGRATVAENGYTETVGLSTERAHSGKTSLKISGRKVFWNGAKISLAELKAGGTYVISAWFSYDHSAKWEQEFELNLAYTLNGTPDYPTAGRGKMQSSSGGGNWTQLKGEITIPDDAENIELYVQTSYSDQQGDHLMDFYIDDVMFISKELQPIEYDIPSLKDVYAGYFKIGGAAEAREVSIRNGKELFLKHYNSITFGNELKPESLLDQDASKALLATGNGTNPQIKLDKAKSLLKFAEDNNIPVRGHALVWHSQTPDWFFKDNYEDDGNWVTKEVMLKRMENYIKNVMTTLATDYPNVEFYAWDVVNEAFSNDGGSPRQPGSDKQQSGTSAWVKIFGDNSFIEPAFTYARQYAPKDCKLFYNDFNEYISQKRDAIYTLAMGLKEKGVIDGIGMQMHLDLDFPSSSDVDKAVEKFASTGLEVQFTELDMTTNDKSAQGLLRQAAKYKEIMNIAVKYSDVITAVVFWGTNDANSWRNDRVPLLFDAQYQAKPAFFAVVEGVEPREVPPTTAKQTTTAVKTGKLGDLNGDGEVTIEDVVVLRLYLMKPDVYPMSAEAMVNALVIEGQKSIQGNCAVTIQDYVVEKIKSLPYSG